jgi:Secretion system C-terminal sorting domain
MKKLISIIGFALLIVACITIAYSPLLKSKLHLTESKEMEGEENETDGMLQAMALEKLKTQDPALLRIPTERLAAASKKIDDMMQNLAPQFRTNALAWSERGPNNIGGRTRAILFDKADVGNGYKKVWAGGVGGGLWYTTDITAGTVTWVKVNDQMENLAITCIAQNPNNSLEMYVGTGEGWYNADAIRGYGIFKTSDGGTTWTRLTSTASFSFVNDIAVDGNGNVFASCIYQYSGDSYGLQKSSNGGTSWTQVLGSPVFGSSTTAADIEIAANGDMYVSLGIFDNGGIYTSTVQATPANTGNAGTWTNITPNTSGTIATPSNSWHRIELATAPSNSNVVYALFQGYGSDDCTSIQSYNKATNTWTVRTVPTIIDQGSNSNFTRQQAWYDLIATVDPNNASSLYIGGVDCLRSDDAGATWTQMTTWSLFAATGFTSAQNVHADNHQIVYVPGSSSRMLVSNDGGIYYTTDANASPSKPTFTVKNNGYNVTQYYAMAMHPSTTNYFLAGAQDNGTHKLASAGVGAATSASGGDGAFCQISQKNPSIQLTSYVYQNIYRSNNGGSSFPQVIASNFGRFINPSDYDDNTGILYMANTAGSMARVINLVSGTPTREQVTVSALGSTQISAVKVDPNASNTVWVGGSGSGAPVILKLTNANGTPTSTNVSIAGATSGSYVSNIDVERDNSNHLLVTCSNYGVVSVFESTNGGTSWTAIEGTLPDMPVRWGIFLPAGSTEGVIALATELGVFTTSATTGGTTTWVSNNSGFPKVRTDMLKYRQGDNTLAAATHGRGIFTSTLGIPPVTWTGGSSNVWTTVGNWSPARVPGITDEVVIPSVTTLPTITTSQKVGKLTINSGATVTLNSALTVASNLTNNGNITGTGTVTISGFSGQTISGTGSIKNLTTSNDVTITSGAGNTQSITGLLTVSSGTLTTNSNIVLKSTSIANTAMFAALPIGATISGDVTIERFIPASNRAFRLIAPGVTTTTTIKANWQEGVNVTSPSGYPNAGGTANNPFGGYGTHITGSTTGANGFDATTSGVASLFTFTNATQAWGAVANTSSATLTARTGYRILIRGDRSTNLTSNTPTVTATTLRATGKLDTGAIAASSLATAINQYSFMGNPYWAPVDWTLLQAAATNVSTTYWIWDPTITGTNGKGGYTSFTRTGVGTGTSSGGGSINKNIQPGQAFFIQNSAATPTLSFAESHKDVASGLTSTFRTSNNSSGTDGVISIKLFLKDNYATNQVADGVSFAFRKDFKKDIDVYDAEKLPNPDESISFKTSNKFLGFDARIVPTQADTLFLNMGNMLSKNYLLQLEGTDFSNNIVQAYLYDSYLKKRTYINLSGAVTVNYDIDNNTLSSAANRFYIVLNKTDKLAPLQTNVLQASVFPNPVVGDYTLLSFTSPEKGKTSVRIINALGQTVQQLNLGELQSGMQQLNVKQLQAGLYNVQVMQGNQKVMVPMLKL